MDWRGMPNDCGIQAYETVPEYCVRINDVLAQGKGLSMRLCGSWSELNALITAADAQMRWPRNLYWAVEQLEEKMDGRFG
jgi:hypothetical protein